MSEIVTKTKNKITKIAKSDSAKKAIEKTGNVVTNPLFLKVALGCVLLYGGYKVVKSITNKITGDDIDDNVGGTGGDYPKATITNTQANNYAQQLLDACNSMFPMYGTDDELILSVFKKFKHPDDFIKVFHAFGLKDYNGYNSPPTGIFSALDSYEKRNLVHWLKSELDDSQGEPVYTLVKSVIESAGFAY